MGESLAGDGGLVGPVGSCSSASDLQYLIGAGSYFSLVSHGCLALYLHYVPLVVLERRWLGSVCLD